MKNVLFVAHDDAGQEARFQAALDLTRALEGHLSCLDVTVTPMLFDDQVSSGAYAILAAQEADQEKGNQTRLTERLKAEDVPWGWVAQGGEFEVVITDAARMADVIVLNNAFGRMDESTMIRVAGRLLIDADKPVLAVPDEVRGIDFAGAALIAWDGSVQSEAAMQAAVPLLALAGEVTLLEVDDGSVRVPAEQAAQYLSRHSIHATVERRHGAGTNAQTVLLDEVSIRRPAYLVMGGFGHSRLAQALFGGVTLKMLHESPVPLFLAH